TDSADVTSCGLDNFAARFERIKKVAYVDRSAKIPIVETPAVEVTAHKNAIYASAPRLAVPLVCRTLRGSQGIDHYRDCDVNVWPAFDHSNGVKVKSHLSGSVTEFHE